MPSHVTTSYSPMMAQIYRFSSTARRSLEPTVWAPGTALAQLFVRVIPAELDGYHLSTDALVFLPGGILMVIAARSGLKAVPASVLWVIGVCLPPAVLESILASLSGRSLSRANVSLCILLLIAGILCTSTLMVDPPECHALRSNSIPAPANRPISLTALIPVA